MRARAHQDYIVPADLEVFEHYCIEQFGNLLNLTCATGQRIYDAILAELKGEDLT